MSLLIRTDHYLDRCRERGILASAADVIYTHGELLGRNDGCAEYWLSPLAALRAQQVHQLDLWRHAEVAVEIADDSIAVTAFRLSEERARQRRSRSAS